MKVFYPSNCAILNWDSAHFSGTDSKIDLVWSTVPLFPSSEEVISGHDALPGFYISLAYLSMNAYASVPVFGKKTVYSSLHIKTNRWDNTSIKLFEMYVTNVFFPSV